MLVYVSVVVCVMRRRVIKCISILLLFHVDSYSHAKVMFFIRFTVVSLGFDV